MVITKNKKKEITSFQRFLSKVRHGLVLHSIRNQLSMVGIKITPYYWVQEGLNPANEPMIKGDISDCTIGFLEAEELVKIRKDLHSYSLDFLLDYLKAGKKCLGLKYKDELASFMFINFTECDFTSCFVKLKEDEAYLTFMYTMEAYRGRNMAPYLRYKSYQILKEMGRKKIYSVSAFFNSSAIRYKEKLNAKNIRLVLYLEIFKRIKGSFTLKTY